MKTYYTPKGKGQHSIEINKHSVNSPDPDDGLYFDPVAQRIVLPNNNVKPVIKTAKISNNNSNKYIQLEDYYRNNTILTQQIVEQYVPVKIEIDEDKTTNAMTNKSLNTAEKTSTKSSETGKVKVKRSYNKKADKKPVEEIPMKKIVTKDTLSTLDNLYNIKKPVEKKPDLGIGKKRQQPLDIDMSFDTPKDGNNITFSSNTGFISNVNSNKSNSNADNNNGNRQLTKGEILQNMLRESNVSILRMSDIYEVIKSNQGKSDIDMNAEREVKMSLGARVSNVSTLDNPEYQGDVDLKIDLKVVYQYIHSKEKVESNMQKETKYADYIEQIKSLKKHIQKMDKYTDFILQGADKGDKRKRDLESNTLVDMQKKYSRDI